MSFSKFFQSMFRNKRKSRVRISGNVGMSQFFVHIMVSMFFIGLFIFMVLARHEEGENLFTTILYPIYAKVIDSIGVTTSIIIVCVSSVIVSLIVLIQSKITFKRIEKIPTNIDIYQRELPSNLKPAHVRVLLKDGLVDKTTLACTILDLVDRGYLKIEKEQNNKKVFKLDLFKKENVVLCKTKKSVNDLFPFEKYIIEWFIDECGDGRKVTSKQLRDTIKNSPDLPLGAQAFEKFQTLVMDSFPIDTFYDEFEGESPGLFLVLGIFLSILQIIPIVSAIWGMYAWGKILLDYHGKYLNQAGVEEKDRWEDLKKYLLDYGDMKSKTLEQVEIWNFYLTYSIALGIDGIASDEIEDFFGDNIYLV